MKYSGNSAHKGSKSVIIISSIGLILLVIGISSVLFVFRQHGKQQDDMNNVTVIKKRVAVLYQLPTNEEPALATVTDKAKLESTFAGKVENDDKILIYEKNGKAIVYRPSINKIVDVEPVQIDNVDTLKK